MSRTFRFLLGLVLLCIIGSAGFISYKVFFSNPARALPLLKSSSVVEAVQTLERLGIKARIEEENSAMPRGTVVNQWPAPGVKLRGDQIAILKVSKGSDKKALPDLRGLTQNQAIERLQQSGFIAGEIQKISNDRPAGSVIATNPASPASLVPGREVGLLVSLGPATSSGLIVPDLIQRDENTALQLARESGLSPLVSYVYTQASPQGMVIGMTPAAGTKVVKGSVLSLRVATWNTRYAVKAEAPKEKDDVSGDKKEPVVSEGVTLSGDKSDTGAKKVVAVAPAAGKKQEVKQEPVVTTVQKLEPVVKASLKKKNARIRYKTPPVSNQNLLIEIVDAEGERTLLSRKVNKNEVINMTAPYTGSAIVTIQLGGRTVWQESYR